MAKTVDTPQIEAYPRTFTLIPLYAYTATSKAKSGKVRREGKRPLHKDWTRRTYSREATLAHARERNGNVGIRLRPTQLVIDVDPRNGGDDGFAALCSDLGIDASQFHHTITGSGGDHYLMSKPEGVLVRDTLPDYAGVEFKSKGRQVVAAGSIHPDSKLPYKWDTDGPAIDEPLKPAPRVLLNLIARPERTSTVSGGGQYTPEQLAKALDGLDARKYREHEKWLALMMSCHHATNGEGRGEWVDFSISDPEFADSAEEIGRRWDSLHTEKNDGWTYKTLNRELAMAGQGDRQVVHGADAADDFGDFDDPDDGGPSTPNPKAKKKTKKAAADDMDFDTPATDDADDMDFDTPVDEDLDERADSEALVNINKEYSAVMLASKFKVMRKVVNPSNGRIEYEFITRQDFESKFANRSLERAKEPGKKAPDAIKLGKAWIEWPKRKEYNGLLFDPTQGAVHEGWFNMWQGFAYDDGVSKNGSWKRLEELIFEALADGNQEHFDYIMNWLAFLFQYPEQRAETALVFQGGMGVGKGTLGNTITKLIGQHAMAVASPELITGRFNSHLQDLLFLFADEAVKPYDKAATSRLRSIITEPTIQIEGKGRDVKNAEPNYVHVMMASNEEWLVPAGRDERRFFVAKVNPCWQGQLSRFQKLWDELKANHDSGYKALLRDLKIRPLPPGFHPRKVPTTAALIEQKINSGDPVSTFLLNMIRDQAHDMSPIGEADWTKKPIRLFVEDFKQSFNGWCKTAGINPGGGGRSNTHVLMNKIKESLPSSRVGLRLKVDDDRYGISASPSDNRAPAIELPALPQCREDFEKVLRGKIVWGRGITTDSDAEFG